MRTPHIIGVIVLVAAAAVGGWFVGRGDTPPPAPVEQTPTADAPKADPLDWRARFDYEDQLPEFVDPGEGPRAPTNDAFGLNVGASTLDEVKAWVARRKLVCSDTSVRALMARYRDKKVAEIKAAEAAGEADGTSGASWLYRSSKHEKNPQVRLACENVPLDRIGDRARPEGALGRLLFIFDSAAHPLRRVVVQRRHTEADHAPLRAQFVAAEEALTGLFGEPETVKQPLPAEGESFAMMRPYRRHWRFADLEVKVSALRLKSGVTLYEEVGVPWPVRADAPAKAGGADKGADKGDTP